MKTILKLVVAVATVALSSNVSAQNVKLAHINLQELIISMPEFTEAQEKLQKLGQELSDEIDELQVELNQKYEELSKVQESLTDLVRQSRWEEIQRQGERLERFQQNAQATYQQEQEKLMQPVIEKANKAVEAVAKDQGITYVISSDPSILLFKATDTIDLLPAVKKHLGIE